MAASSSRYVVEVQLDDPAAGVMARVWCGSEEEHDGLSVQEERLDLRLDGTFQHRVGHRLAMSSEAPGTSSVSGRWRLFQVKHFGADADALGDQELHFEAGSGGQQPLVKKLVVCGLNPQVNGFIGHTCRLYPEKPVAPGAGRPRSVRVQEPEEENEEEDAGEEEYGEDFEPDEQTVTLVAEAASCSADAALAALMEQGSAEQAIAWLVENTQPGAVDTEGDGPQQAQGEQEDAAQQLHAATGRPLGECRAALGAHGGRVDAAANYLLALGAGSSEPTAPAESSQASEGAASRPGEAAQAARLAEMTGKSYQTCRDALRKHGGQADAAADELLGEVAVDGVEDLEACDDDDPEPAADDDPEPAAKRARGEPS